MIPEVLSQIKPAYPHLVHYSAAGEPALAIPDMQHFNESALPEATPNLSIDVKANQTLALDLRRAAEAFSTADAENDVM